MIARFMEQSGDLAPKLKTYASQIVGTTERATQILNDLLDITRSAFGAEIPISRQPMDMAELGRNLVDEMQALSEGRQIEIKVTGDTTGNWDRARMGQVFSNLIGNALQHSTASTPIKVLIAGHRPEVEIAIQNDGDPISGEKLKKLFEAGNPGSGPEAAGSTHLGLGLLISRKIATAHGGDITATSTSEAGTTFRVKLQRH